MNYKSNVDIDLGAIEIALQRMFIENTIDEIMGIIEENIYYINREDEE